MKKLVILLLLCYCKVYSQNCNDIDTNVNMDYIYENTVYDFSLPFNKDWKILFENQKAIIVGLSDPLQYGNASVLLNKNEYPIASAHAINDEMIVELSNGIGKRIGSNFKILSTRKSFLKNIKVNIVEYDYLIKNLDNEYQMTGIMFQIVKKQNSTYIFMFNCLRSLKECYLPFFNDIMMQAYFGQEWYSLK